MYSHKRISFFLFVFFLITGEKIDGNEMGKISFHDLINHPSLASEWQNKPVEIRGFLYQDSGNQWVLSSEPNLKSCCVGSTSKAGQQILLRTANSFHSKTKRAVVIQGILDLNSNSAYKFTLKDAKLINSKEFNHTNASLIGLIVAVSFLFYLLRRRFYRYVVSESRF